MEIDKNHNEFTLSPFRENLLWYDKLFLAKKLINSIIPKNYEQSHDIEEIIWITDNLYQINPCDRLKLLLQLLNEVKDDYFQGANKKMKQNNLISVDFLAGFLLALTLISLPVIFKAVIPEYVAEVVQWD